MDIGNLSELQTFSDTVGPTDRNDFYKFTLSENSNVSFNLSNLGPEPAQLEILGDVDGDGTFSSRTETIQSDTVSDTSSSTEDRSIDTPLSAGTYWARVVTWYDYQNSGYTLTAQATPTSRTSVEPGNSLGEALDIGVLGEAQTFTETVGSLDRNDYYTFTLDQFAQVDLTLKDLQAPAQLSLLVDFDGDGIWDRGEEISSDSISDSANSTEERTIGEALAPGTYWLDIWTQYSNQNTSYALDIAAISPLDITATDPGNSLSTAKDIGLLNEAQTFVDFIGSRDRADIYKFSLDQSSEVALSLSGLREDAELSLILDADSDGEIDYRETLSQTRLYNDSADRSFTYPLGVGDYFVQVSTDTVDSNTPYTLSLSPTVLSIPDNAGATFSSARDLGELAGTQQFTDYVGELIDPNDYYRFTLATDSSVSIAVAEAEEGSDVRFEIYDSSENRFITSTDATSLNLFSGDYYARVFSRTGSSDYTLDLETTARVDQAGNSFDSARNIGILTNGEQTFSDWLGSIDGNDYYRFELLDDSSIDISLDGLTENANIALLDENGRRIARSTNSGTTTDAIALSDIAAGTYYLQVYQASSRVSTDYTVSLSATPEAPTPFDVVSITPDAGSNKGQATVTITGAQFSPNAQVSLIDVAGNSRTATQLIWQSSRTVIGTFDLTGLEEGQYDISVVDTAGTETLTDVFTVTDGNGGQLEVTLSSPRAVRPWWTGEVVVSYRNMGDSDIIAPLLSLSADNARFRNTGEEQFNESTVQFLGINGTGPAGILPAGASGTATIAFQPDESITEIDFAVSTVQADEVVDWAALKEGAKPSNINGDAWDAVWDNFTRSVGDSAGDYQAVLAENATRLAQLGDRTNDVSQLLSFELQQSSDYQAITQRYSTGSLGRGQTFLGDLQLTTDAEGNITIQNGLAQRIFTIQPDGSYQAESSDNGILVAVGSGYQLTEQPGTISVFNAEGRLDYIEDTNGNRISANYLDRQLISLSDSNGGSLTFTYQNNRVISVEDEVGRTTTYTYDDSNEYIETITNLSGTTTYTYNDRGFIETITDPENTVVEFEYDEQGRVSKQSVNGQESISYRYDSAGGITITEATDEGTTQILLNERGQVGQLTDAAGRAVQYRYDNQGNLTRVIGPNNTTTSFAYNEIGQLVGQTDANGQQTLFSYENEFGKLETVTDARGNVLRYAYDSRSNLEKISYADDSSEIFEYNDEGEVETYVNRRGQETTYRYEDRQIVEKSVGGDDPTTYSYDARGNLELVSNGQGETQMAYDAADRLEKITYPTGRFLEFEYDNADRRTRLADQDGNVVNYAYDNAGRLKTLTDGDNALIVDYSYDANGRLAREDKGNGTYSTHEYLPTGELESLVHFAPDGSVNARFDYAYDSLGRQTSMTTLDGIWQYGYDSVGQLTSAIFDSTNEEISSQNLVYVYDAAGNRVRTIENGVTIEYVTNALNQYEQVGDTTYSYDDDGNLASKTDEDGTTIYEYNSDNRLVKVTAPGDVVTEYEYGAFGDRVATVHEGNRTEYLIDPFGVGDVVGEYSDESLLVSYSHGIGLERQLRQDSSEYFDFDAVGSTNGVTGSTGEYVNRYDYLPYGHTTDEVEIVPNSFEYIGQWGVSEDQNNLMFMRARFYNSRDGRFTSTDPLGLNGGSSNLYQYANNQPVGLIDPDGERAKAAARFARVVHYQRNIFNERPSYPYSADSLRKQGWVQVPDREARFHQQGTGNEGNTKWVKQNERWWGSSEAVFTPNWELVTDPLNRGTYNYFDNRWLWGVPHTIFDIAPYIPWGNSPIDFFNPERFKTFAEAARERLSENNAEISGSSTNVVVAIDPNDIVGPTGYGDQNWISTTTELPYTIRFENDPERGATAPAVFVTVTHQLDADLDWNTFELGDFGFNNLSIDVPDGLQSYTTQVQVPNEENYFVDFQADFDPLTGQATWRLSTIDSRTGSFPNDAFAGFLPVNGDNSEGEGYINYTIQPDAEQPTGTEISAIANIVFDTNPPIPTDEDAAAPLNTIDAEAPVSTVSALPTSTDSPDFTVSWSGTDSGSGISSYDIYVSVDDAPFTLWLDSTTETNAIYQGQAGSQYAFYSIARDNVGQLQALPTTAQAVTTVEDAEAGIGDFSIRGIVWQDLNSNGVQDGEETGVSYWSVYIDSNNNNQLDADEVSAQTDALGQYQFNNLLPGLYTVAQVVQDGWQSTLSDNQTTAQLPFIADSANNQGTAAWNTYNLSTLSPLEVGHTVPIEGLGNAYYYLASRNYDDIDPNSDGALQFTVPTSGFQALTEALRINGYAANDLTIQFGLASLGDDIEGEDWFVSGNTEVRYYTGGEVTFQIAGEDILTSSLDKLTLRIDYNDPADFSDDFISGWSSGLIPVISETASDNLEEIANIFIQELDAQGFDILFGALEPASQFDFIDEEKVGGFYDSTGWIQPSSGYALRSSQYTAIVEADEGTDNINFGNVRSQPVAESIVGTDGVDSLTGTSMNDTLYAGAGDDVIEGGDGWDTLYGEAGDDILSGGRGKDVLIGGEGDDTYRYQALDSRVIISDDGFSDNDVVMFASGISREQASFAIREGKANDLDITTGEAGDLVRVIGQFSD